MSAPGDRQGVWLIDGASGERIRDLLPQIASSPYAISLDGKQMALSVRYAVDISSTTLIHQFGKTAAKPIRLAIPTENLVQFSPDGTRLAAAYNGRIGMWDLNTGKSISLPAFVLSTHHVAFNRDMNEVLSSGYFQPKGRPGGLAVWLINPVLGEPLQHFMTHGHGPIDIALSADGKQVAIGDTTVALYDAAADKPARVLTPRDPGEKGSPIIFSTNGKLLAVASFESVNNQGKERRMLLFDVQTGQRLHTFPGKADGREVIAFSQDGTKLAMNSFDRVTVWTTDTGKRVCDSPPGSTASPRLIWFSPDGKIVAGVDEHQVVYCDAATGERRLTLIFLDMSREWFAATPDGFFDGSEGGRKIIGVRTDDGMKIVPIHESAPRYYRPGILDSILSGERPK
jgi:WD40 repeat protein